MSDLTHDRFYRGVALFGRIGRHTLVLKEIQEDLFAWLVTDYPNGYELRDAGITGSRGGCVETAKDRWPGISMSPKDIKHWRSDDRFVATSGEDEPMQLPLKTRMALKVGLKTHQEVFQDLLRKMLLHQDPTERAAACSQITSLGSKGSTIVYQLWNVARSDPDRKVCVFAAMALRYLNESVFDEFVHSDAASDALGFFKGNSSEIEETRDIARQQGTADPVVVAVDLLSRQGRAISSVLSGKPESSFDQAILPYLPTAMLCNHFALPRSQSQQFARDVLSSRDLIQSDTSTLVVAFGTRLALQ